MSQNLAQQYDAIPFPSLPIARSQPEFLETIARLRGLHPTPAQRAKVLELGCAAGGNLLPLAERYPEATLRGVDLSTRQIELAAQTATENGLANVTFQAADLLQLGPDLGTFDYIIAHGVYSWVDAPARDKLLAICQAHLAPQGVAYVSYKVYPGWNLHDMFRHMMQYDSRQVPTPVEKVNRARMFLQFVQGSLDGNSPYEVHAREEAELLLKQRDDYLWHDHLEEFSHPVYFQDFMQHAQSHQLQLLGDAANGMRYVDYLGPEIEPLLEQVSRDSAEREQFRDIIRNRGMRQTLLTHAGLQVIGATTPDRLDGLYLEGNLRPETGSVDLRSQEIERFVNPAGARVGSPQPLVKAALLHLGEVWPSFVSLEELITAATERVAAAGTASASQEEIPRLKENLLQCCLGHVLLPHAAPASFVPRPSDKPLASPLARWQVRTTDVTASRRHEAIRLDPFDRQVLSYLDGTLDSAQLTERLATDVASGRLVIMEKQQRLTAPDDVRRALAVTLPESLMRMARIGLLIA